MNINEMMKQAKKMQAEMDIKEKAFNKREFVIEKQGLKLVMLGNKKIKTISIDPILIDEDDIELLEDMITLSINESIDKINEEFEAEQPKMPNGMAF